MHRLFRWICFVTASISLSFGLVGIQNIIGNKSIRSPSLLSAIALTREKGTNEKLEKLLSDLECYEIPCIQFDKGPDITNLGEAIVSHDCIAITSPQAASVFLEVWESMGRPEVQVATVGKGTSKPLISAGIKPFFEPSDATATTFAAELPIDMTKSVLYPCSALADNKLTSGLQNRGFQVTRLNTYTTVPAVWSDEDWANARKIDIVTFASPSTIKVWAERIGVGKIAVTIGPTSERAARAAGFSSVFSPDVGSKGVEAWAKLIREVSLKHSV